MFDHMAIFNLGAPELLLILLIVLLLFGGRKLPELAKSAGLSVRELKKGLKEGGDEKGQKDKKQEPKA